MEELLSAVTAAATTDDFTVTSSSGVSCYGMDGRSEVVGQIYKKNSDASYSPLKAIIGSADKPVLVRLTGVTDTITIVQPGVYRVEKFVTVGTVGIDVTPAS